MKQIILLLALLSAQRSIAQPPRNTEIKKNKIKKITIYAQPEKAEEPVISEYYYDLEGNDTSKYEKESRSWYRIIVYNAKGKPDTITEYKNAGEEAYTSIYTYKPDGGYTIKRTDKQFGMVDVSVYTKIGNIQSLISPDGTESKYIYTGKMKLNKIITIPKKDGVKITRNYLYDPNGKWASSVTSGDFPNTVTYEYNTRGLLKKQITTSTMNGEKSVFVETMEYSY